MLTATEARALHGLVGRRVEHPVFSGVVTCALGQATGGVHVEVLTDAGNWIDLTGDQALAWAGLRHPPL